MKLADRNFSVNQKLDVAKMVGKSRFSTGKTFGVKAADGQGFITCQWGLKEFRYGMRGSDKNGCGWIAAYNLLKILGESPAPAEVARQFEKYRVALGILGTTAAAFYPYFHKKGYKVQPVLTWNLSKLENKLLAGRGAVLFYLHPKLLKGGHFVAVHRAGNEKDSGKLIFYNALNRHLQDTGRQLEGIPLYRQQTLQDIRTLRQFVADEKAYYKSRCFPAPFYAVCIFPEKRGKQRKGYSYQEIF